MLHEDNPKIGISIVKSKWIVFFLVTGIERYTYYINKKVHRTDTRGNQMVRLKTSWVEKEKDPMYSISW